MYPSHRRRPVSRYPDGIAVDAAGNVYVADAQNYSIQVFAPGT
ncbi:MAG: hypothetical protein EXR54_08370 [Dehalococcoidia bacterium]|nr:hypothetical protein [Dehalococcoidia bacterium]MSQ17554.1 hypothetical protein [Dehalococcoidia bacterium]